MEKRLKEILRNMLGAYYGNFSFISVLGGIFSFSSKYTFTKKKIYLTFSKSKEILAGVERELLKNFNIES